MKVVITGGAGFVGSHAAEFYADKGHSVTVIDNLARAQLLGKEIKNLDHNWKLLSNMKNIKLVRADICNFGVVKEEAKNADAVLHLAAQTAVTSSVANPTADFRANALGTFNVLEAARQNDVKTVVYASTNKVYGENVNKAGVTDKGRRYEFSEEYKDGIPESFSIDLCEHTPYGCSKLTGDLYAQDYGHLYGIKTGVFRMSCIYGTRQFGVEDQGWIAWFGIANALNKPITIYGDGKQVRDTLYVSDLIDIYDRFVTKAKKPGVYNTGGGPENTLSLLELLDLLEQFSGKKMKVDYSDWRPSDQKVYISDIRKAERELEWKPKVSPEEGVKKLYDWVQSEKNLFE